MPLTSQELVTASACLDSCTSDGLKQSIIIYLLATIAGVPTDAQTLVRNAACLDNCIPVGMGPSIITSLLDTIASAPAPVPAAGLLCGSGAPVAAPTTTCGIYLDTDNDAVYVYRLGAWVLKI